MSPTNSMTAGTTRSGLKHLRSKMCRVFGYFLVTIGLKYNWKKNVSYVLEQNGYKLYFDLFIKYCCPCLEISAMPNTLVFIDWRVTTVATNTLSIFDFIHG